MNIISYKSVENFYFDDNIEIIKSKLNTNYSEDILEVIGKKTPRIYVDEFDLMISFNEDFQSIRYFEFFKPKTKLEISNFEISNKSYDELEKIFLDMDSKLEILDSGFSSKKMGVNVSRVLKDDIFINEIDSILIFSETYYSEPEINLDDLYKSIMGDDYDPETEVEKWK